MKIFQRINLLIHDTFLRVDDEPSHLRRAYRLVYYTLRGVNVHRTMVDSAALTLYTMLALVPLLTLVLLILGQFGVLDRYVVVLHDGTPQQWHSLLDVLLGVAQGAAESIAPGFLAVVGVAILLFAIFTLFRTVEGSFNLVWGVTRKRKFIHRYAAYIIVALFVPSLLLVATSMAYDTLSAINPIAELSEVVNRLFSMLLVSMATTLLYKYLPFTRVHWRNAITAGCIAGFALSVLQWGYVYFQSMMSGINLIYGSLAAIPLFIIWLMWSWNIILVGCELSFVWQHRRRYERIDRRRLWREGSDKGDMIRVVIVGSGNVAESFARTIRRKSGLELVQIFARNRQRGVAVAAIGGCQWEDNPKHLAEADLYIIAVSDRAVAELAGTLPFAKEAIVVHTAGSVPMDAIPEREGGRGILYALQSFSSGRIISLDEVPMFIEADGDETRERLLDIAHQLSTQVEYADSERRRRIHLAGVLVNNFSNHLYTLSAEVLAKEGLTFDIVKPLLLETASKASVVDDPMQVQTGPAIRGDKAVISSHIAMLKDDEQLQKIYKAITESIWETSKRI